MISAGNRPDSPLFSGDEVLSRYLPRYQWRTRASVHVNAGQIAAFDALLHANIQHPLVAAMLRLRGLRHRGSVRQFFVEYGFLILEEERPLHLVVGLISRPWCWSGGAVDVKSREEWLQNGPTSHVKIVSIFGARSVDDRNRSIIYRDTGVCRKPRDVLEVLCLLVRRQAVQSVDPAHLAAGGEGKGGGEVTSWTGGFL